MVALRACFPRRAALHATELFQPAMVRSAVGTDGLEIGQTAVPTIERYVAWRKAARFGGVEHGAEVRVLGQPIEGLAKQPIVARDGV